MNPEKWMLPGVIAVTLVCLLLQLLDKPDLEFVDSDAPDSVYSGERTLTLLNHLLAENVPHVTGSEENRRVKRRIIEWLEGHGIAVEEQRSWGCHPDRGRCAWVENLIATIPGASDGPHVALMAHYDSVNASPGAGDDALGVAIVMEIGRMIQAQGKPPHPLMLIITDGEEPGLLGASAFFEKHALAHDIAAVINIEGTGSKGRSILFRSAHGNQDIVEAMFGHATAPYGSSFAGELFNLLDSDTDMTVARSYDVRAVDIGFSGGGNHHYHTMGDNAANMDPLTAQHHGDSIYAMVKGLMLDDDLSALSTEEVSYENLYGFYFIWTTGVDVVLLLLTLGLFGVSAFRLRPPVTGLLLGFVYPLLMLVAILLVTVGLSLGLHQVRGETSMRPASDWPYLLLLFGVPAGVGLAAAQLLNRKLSTEASYLGIWAFWLLISALLTWFAPRAAYLTVIPVAIASLAVFLVTVFRANLLLLLLPIVALVPLSIAKVLQMYGWQGFWITTVLSIPFLTFFLSAITPMVRGELARPSVYAALAVVSIGVSASLYLPSYSGEKPHTMNYQVVQDIDRQAAWIQYLSFNPAPPGLVTREFMHVEAVYPWGDKEISDLNAEVEVTAVAPTQFDAVRTSDVVEVTIASQRESARVGLVIPQSSGLTHFVLEGHEYDITPAWWSDYQDNFVLEFRGVQHKTVELALGFPEGTPEVEAWLFELTFDLPEQFQADLDARAQGALPIHDGDRFMEIRKVKF